MSAPASSSSSTGLCDEREEEEEEEVEEEEEERREEEPVRWPTMASRYSLNLDSSDILLTAKRISPTERRAAFWSSWLARREWMV